MSRCLGRVKKGRDDFWSFHFIGFFKGLKVREIRATSRKSFKVKDDYILHLRFIKLEKDILYVDILRSKNLEMVLIGHS